MFSWKTITRCLIGVDGRPVGALSELDLSPASIASRNVLAQAALALDEGKEVIPVLHQECKIPFRLRPLQYADFSTNYANGLEELFVVLTGGQETTPSAMIQ